jgi:hypothetical protein
MKYLQTRENRKEIEPKLLEMGVDFSSIQCYNNEIIINYNGDDICLLPDCYQSRPLIEIDGFCEFDVIEDKWEDGSYFNLFLLDDYRLMFVNIKGGRSGLSREYKKAFKYESIGSIFNSENKVNYPELYEEALKIINEVKKYL